MNLPTFSIVVPTYNRPKELLRCLDALRRIDYPEDRFEVIVVDDGSRPGIPDLGATRFPLRTLRQSNGGAGSARNSGAKIARGEYLAFTDDDCMPDPFWLRSLARAAQQAPGCGIGGRTENGVASSICSEASQAVQNVMHGHFNRAGGRCVFFPSNNACFPRKDFLETGGFDASFRISEDRDFCDRWLGSGRSLVHCAGALVFHLKELNARTLFEMHYSYGKGARRYYSMRRNRGQKGLSIDWGFYRKLLLHPFQRSPRSLRLFGAILLTQSANALGYFTAIAEP